MKFSFALVIALFFSLALPALSQDGPDIFPDEYTRKIARELDLKSVKSVYINASTEEVTVTDPRVIALLIEGFKTANTTNFTNKTDYVEVNGKDGHSLIEYRFSLGHFPEVSPELMAGFKAAGIEPEGYREWKDRKQRTGSIVETAQYLLKWALPLITGALVAFFIFRRKTRSNRQ